MCLKGKVWREWYGVVYKRNRQKGYKYEVEINKKVNFFLFLFIGDVIVMELSAICTRISEIIVYQNTLR